ncbi:trypsin, partial [Ostertagia ostertagi]
ASSRKNPDRAFILTGLRSLHDPQHTHHVERAVVHPGYDENTIANDIALVKSEFPLLATGVSSVCFAREDSSLIYPNSEAIVVGFGNSHRREWSALTGGAVLISDKQLCAGSKLHGTAPGDSGGPLLVRDRLGRLVQVGITSFGAGGFQGLVDQSTYPGVYTRVSPYITWMEQVTNSGITPFHLLSVTFMASVICLYERME